MSLEALRKAAIAAEKVEESAYLVYTRIQQSCTKDKAKDAAWNLFIEAQKKAIVAHEALENYWRAK